MVANQNTIKLKTWAWPWQNKNSQGSLIKRGLSPGKTTNHKGMSKLGIVFVECNIADVLHGNGNVFLVYFVGHIIQVEWE
jgi:hypothetical protein